MYSSFTKDHSQQHCPHVSPVAQRTSTHPMYKTGISSEGWRLTQLSSVLLTCCQWCRITGFSQAMLAVYCSNYTSDVISNTRIKKVFLDKDVSLPLSESEAHPTQHFMPPPPTAAAGIMFWRKVLLAQHAHLFFFSLHVFLDNQCPLSDSSQSAMRSNHTTLNVKQSNAWSHSRPVLIVVKL